MQRNSTLRFDDILRVDQRQGPRVFLLDRVSILTGMTTSHGSAIPEQWQSAMRLGVLLACRPVMVSLTSSSGPSPRMTFSEIWACHRRRGVSRRWSLRTGTLKGYVDRLVVVAAPRWSPRTRDEKPKNCAQGKSAASATDPGEPGMLDQAGPD